MSPRDALLAAMALALSEEFGPAAVPALCEELSAAVDPDIDPFALEDLQFDLQGVLLARFGREEAVRVLRKTFACLVTIAGADEPTKVGRLPGPSAASPAPATLGPTTSEQTGRGREVLPVSLSDPSESYPERSEVAVIVDLATFNLRAFEARVQESNLLVVLTGPQLGDTFELKDGASIIGRSSRCDIPVKDEGVSRNHAKLVLTENGLALSDLGSTNGTFVNRNQVADAILRDGDLIRVANTILKFMARRMKP